MATRTSGNGRANAAVTGPDEQPLARSSIEQLVAQQASLAQIGHIALTQTDIAQLFNDVCNQLRLVLDAEYSSILELSSDSSSLTVVAGSGWRRGIIGTVLGAGNKSVGGYALQTGGPVIVTDLATDERLEPSTILNEHGIHSGMSVRIGEAALPFGTLSVFTKRPSRFTRDDANFLEAAANVLAAAVGRVRIEHDLRESRDQLAAIVTNIDEGITVLSRTGLVFANDAAARLSGFASAAEMAATPPREIMNRYEIFDENGEQLATEDLPSRQVMGGAEDAERVVGFRVKATGEERYSSVRATAVRDMEGAPTYAISIFRDVTDERWQAQARAFMSDAVAVLSSTLDAAEAARQLAELSVPRLADYCTVDLLRPDGSIDHVALVHADPTKVDIALRLREMQPVDPAANTGIARVIRDGTAEKGIVTPEILEAANLPVETLDLLNKLDLRSYLLVPLVGRHGSIGGLSLIMSESGRVLGDRDFSLALELGQRAGVALENAQLYKTADDRRAQLDTVLAALEEAVIVYDGTGRLRLGNRAAAGIFEGILPTTLDELWQRLTPLPGGPRPESMTTDDGVEVQADGSHRWFELRRYGTARDAGDGLLVSPPPTVIVLRDVTQARAARAARDAFLGVLSHELRTPITTIYGGIELLERDLNRDRRREVLADIRIESERLVRLVEDLLVMTRVERSAVEIGDEPVLIQHLLSSILAKSPGRWGGARIELRVGERLPAVRGDSTYIEQVVRNFLTNALRYGRGYEEGVEIRAGQTDDFVAVRVLDHGGGLGGEEPEKLFELFYRSAGARSIPGGAGIGLFVSRHLIEAMGGRIWAQDRPEGGAEFGFALPIIEPESAV